MKTRWIGTFSALALLAGGARAAGQGTAFTYQGQLTLNGTCVSGPMNSLSFALYNDPNAGSQLGSTQYPVFNANNGLFNVQLDFGSAPFTAQNVWLEIDTLTSGSPGPTGTYSPMGPRVQLTPVPFAIFAETAGSANSVANGSISVNQLNALGAPASGQVLGFNGSGLVWVNPAGAANTWSLFGNSGTTPSTDFLGTLDPQPLELRVNNIRGFHLEPGNGGFPNVIGGGAPTSINLSSIDSSDGGATVGGGVLNTIQGSASQSTIAGGAFHTIQAGANNSTIGGGYANRNGSAISVIAGGSLNYIGTNAAGATIAGGVQDWIVDGAQNATIGGGLDNEILTNSAAAVIAGGELNAIFLQSDHSFIGGGLQNLVQGGGQYSFIGGGQNNSTYIGASDAVICGGYANTNAGYLSAIAGGDQNSIGIQAGASGVGGGFKNSVLNNAQYAFIGGGSYNTNAALYSSIGGGAMNLIQSGNTNSSIGGGYNNAVNYNAGASTIAGGAGNSIDNAVYATIGGGSGNVVGPAGGQFTGGVGGTVPGGINNAAGGFCSLAAGNGAYALNDGSFVWADASSPSAFVSTANNQFLIRAAGGVGIGTASPQSALEVRGETRTCVLTITGGCDLAEPFETSSSDIPEGAVVVIDEENPGRLKQSDRAYDTRVAGIVSGANGVKTGIALRQEGLIERGLNVALTGRVYVQADASNGAIRPGDMLTTSDDPGHAMKVSDHAKAQGAILGKAMSGLQEGKGLVLVLVSLQ